MSPKRLTLALALLCGLSACKGTRTLMDPTVVIFTPTGSELGVSTEYGLVFLGHTARSGYVEISSLFGDGPSLESSVIEPLGGGLYTAEVEIRLPYVPMTFREPKPGQTVIISGRTPSGPWDQKARVRTDPRVEGILLDVPGILSSRADQVGAGVYWIEDEEDLRDRRLLGLVSGRVRFFTDEGEREYLTVIGPTELWRLVTRRRDNLKKAPWVYREDIL